MKQAWEYKMIWIDISEGTWSDDLRPLAGPVNMVVKARELGDQGWEMITAIPFSTSRLASHGGWGGGGYTGGETTKLAYWFKRPK